MLRGLRDHRPAPQLAGDAQPCYSHRSYLEHKQEFSAYVRRYRTADPAQHLARVRAWREKNHEQYLEKSRRQQRERYWRRKGEPGAAAEGSPTDNQAPE